MHIMEERRFFGRSTIFSFHLYLCMATAAVPSLLIHCDASRDVSMAPPHSRNSGAKLNAPMKILPDTVRPLNDSPSSSLSNSQAQPYGVSSPFTLPPYDSLAPIPLTQNTPPFCVYPPFTFQPPPASITIPTPTPPDSLSPSFPFPNPTPSPPPQSISTPMPPAIIVPSPSMTVPSPPMPEFSPPFTTIRSPPSSSNPPGPSSGGGFVPSPPVFLPPIVYPPPAVPPPPYAAPTSALWCVAKPSVPGPIIQEALNYACASGADCEEIQPSGSCYEPNTLVAHASYAFNSYWQRTKVAGGTCAFGGIAILVIVDPSYDGCHFIYF